jgi:hypothetical protein
MDQMVALHGLMINHDQLYFARGNLKKTQKVFQWNILLDITLDPKNPNPTLIG